MSTFLQSQSQFTQTHFTVIEIDIPVVEGVCTVSGEPGYGTPLSCDQSSNATRTYKFTQMDAPLLPESGILRNVKSISENTAKLNTGKGLASRGTASIAFIEVKNKDPNPDAPAVDDTVIATGGFMSKLNARNQMTNREVRIKNYRLESDGSIDLANGAQTRYYTIKSTSQNKNGEWVFNCEDELAKINIGDSVWPIPLEGYLRLDLIAGTTTVSVDPNITYLIDDTIRIGEELLKVVGVSNIGTASAQLTVQTRGSNITYTNLLSKTITGAHEAGDEVFVSYVSDNERIDDLLERILLDIGIDQSLIPKSDWAAEIDEWHPTTRVNTLWIESISTSDVLEKILTEYLIDMWFDPVDRQVKISAISVWKESSTQLTEGNEINHLSVTKRKQESLRSTRAYIVYGKSFLASGDDIGDYSKASIFKRDELETTDFFGEPKTKKFDKSFFLDGDSADLLVNRWVNRYINPYSYSWTTEERKLNFNVGDVVDISSSVDVGFDGSSSSIARGQITSINPKYTNFGRNYYVTADSYEPVFATGSERIITGSVSNINLYIQEAGRPSQPIEITFIFDGTISSSTSNITPSIRAGAFPAGSKIIIILANGADLQAKGGNGGDGGSAEYDFESNSWIYTASAGNGQSGGIVYDAEGVDTDIYFSGATPSAAYPVADGYIRAPSGGDGGFDPDVLKVKGGDSGNGGDGRVPGEGGEIGFITPLVETTFVAVKGSTGTDDGFTGSFGQAGTNNDALGGAAGSGIIKGGTTNTVNLIGNTAINYINGNGDF